VHDRLDLTTSRRAPARGGLALNDIGRVRLRVSRPLPVEPYSTNRVTGAFILIDEGTNDTVGAGMIAGASQ
jgi:sulfate adenylyltransferase subunit 1 (EFTu-like GTPase family)